LFVLSYSEASPVAEVVQDPEEARKKEEEQAAKEEARLERMLAKKFVK